MAVLKTDYKDDILDSSVNVNRTFSIIDNTTGQIIYPNVSLEETTVFSQEGDSHTAQITNEQNTEINRLDNSKVSGFTENTYSAVTGLAYDSTNHKLGLKVGADTVIPFHSNEMVRCLDYANAIVDRPVTATADGVWFTSGMGGSAQVVYVNGVQQFNVGVLYSPIPIRPCRAGTVITADRAYITFIPYKDEYISQWLDYDNRVSGGASFTVPKDGFVGLDIAGSGDGLSINGKAIVVNSIYSGGQMSFPVRTGDMVKRTGNYGSITFIPCVESI